MTVEYLDTIRFAETLHQLHSRPLQDFAIFVSEVFDEEKQGSVAAMNLLQGQHQPQKRTKFEEITEKKGEEDVISSLPDCLLLEILSRLCSTKEAIRTGTLSKRWAHLWTLVPTLVFSYSDLPQRQFLENPSPYALLVDKTLAHCRQQKLKKFEVHAYYDTRFESQFKTWIRYAISCNVEQLNLEFWYTSRREAQFQLDQFIFTNSSLTYLRLVGCMLNPIGAICWKNLRNLCISYLYLDGDVILNILSGCPLLETLFLQYCYGYTWQNDIPSETESESNSDSESESEADTIEEINARYSLSLSRCPLLKKLKKFEVATPYEAESESQLNSWIRYVIRCNVEEFTLRFTNIYPEFEFLMDQTVFTGSCLTKLYLKGCVVNPIGAISWNNLRRLCITTRSLDEDLIENILSGSPVLEYLELRDCYGYKRLDITSKSVKNVVLAGFWNHRDDSELDILEINAPNVLFIGIYRNIYVSKLLLVNVSSLVEAKLNYYCTKLATMPKEPEGEILKGCIMNLGHVKEVNIGYLCSKAVSCLQAQGFIFPSNVKFRWSRK